ncbi:hypothetical protein N7466_005733 [Penicillium verhagenii]|uniref:uncharacterized protein n=1 Tax=Penicillium verhagenii TaxID=1562060 RepID=UPI002544F7BF|nr:uncharacterized protein N7466_005733 [Penicillium verhagenii]KAJ5930240.1 hypothetical protein N7466_005733 [Penicillium verhagenii]
MEHPVEEIGQVIRLLTQSPPSLQQKCLERFFTQDASFYHPFCIVPSFEGSRWYVLKIFQWYKIMSPRIELEVHSIGKPLQPILQTRTPLTRKRLAFDEKNLKLFVQMSQVFSIWIVPFHVAPVTLTTVLNLTTESSESNQNKSLYYIKKQEDLYQTSEFIKFLLPHVGHWIVTAWHLFATFFCIIGVYALWPMLWLEENGYLPARIAQGNLASNFDREIAEIKQK